MAGRHLPAHEQDMHSPHPHATPSVNSIPSPPLCRPQTPPGGPDPVLGRTSRSPGTHASQPQSETLHPPTTPHHGQLEDIHNTPSPGTSKRRGNGGHEDHDDHSEDDLPTRKRQKKASGRQKENPVTLLTAAIEKNTQAAERQHRESQELLERTAAAQQNMLNNLLGALQEM